MGTQSQSRIQSVMIIDDEAMIRSLLLDILIDLGYEVSEFSSADDAWVAAKKKAFDLVLIDWNMPGMTGIELCRNLRTLSSFRASVLLMMTGYDAPKRLEEALASGADDYFTKPFEPSFLKVKLTIAEARSIEKKERYRLEDSLKDRDRMLQDEVDDRTIELQERVKELRCLYTISGIIEDPKNDDIEKIAGHVVKAIPEGWRYSETACARIRLRDMVFQSDEFQESSWGQEERIWVKGVDIGSVAVFYREEKPLAEEGPFSKEERNLIRAIAERLGQVSERQEFSRSLLLEEERLSLAIDNSGLGLWEYTPHTNQFVFSESWESLIYGGCGTESNLPREIESFVHLQNLNTFKNQLKISLAAVPSGFVIDFRLVGHTGEDLWVQMLGKMSSYSTATGPAKLIGTIRDISKEHLREEELLRSLEESDRLRQDGLRESFLDMVGASAKMNEVYRQIENLSRHDFTVLLLGATGTGKELAAKAIHHLSMRKDSPFIAVNCGSLPESLLESELLGHVKGAFTGAHQDKKGVFSLAQNGTVFLDEIEAASPHTQVALLRILDQREVMPIGGHSVESLDIRIVVASNQDLEALVEQGLFREDLLYRLMESIIRLPPLTQRGHDILLLADHFFEEWSQSSGIKQRVLSPRALEILQKHPWPGNVRELRNLILSVASSSLRPLVQPADFPETFRDLVSDNDIVRPLADIEKEHFLRAVEVAGGNKSKIAELLQITRSTVYSMMKKHGVTLK